MAQDVAEDNLHFRRYLPKDGLPAAEVQRIYQDSRGFIWAGTFDGLVRFDGRDWLAYRHDPEDPRSLAGNIVHDIKEDATGNLWLGTESGVDCWQRDTELFTHYRHDPADPRSLGNDKVRRLLLNPDGTLWVATQGGALDLLDPRTATSRRFSPYLPIGSVPSTNSVLDLVRDHEGQIWLATDGGGLNRLDPETLEFHYYRHDPEDDRSLMGDAVWALAEDADGWLWVGTAGGLCRLDPTRRFFERFPVRPNDPTALPAPNVHDLLVDRRGRVWVGTDGGGLSCYRPELGTFRHYQHGRYLDNTLSSSVVRDVYEDREGDLWVGNYPNGVNYASRLNVPVRLYRSSPGHTNTLSEDSVFSLLEDPDGGLWVGTDGGGLNHFDRDTRRWKSYQHEPAVPDSLSSDAVLSLARDAEGSIWAGTWNGGLNRFGPGTERFRRYLPEPGRTNALTGLHVWGLAVDHEDRLWVATMGGGLCRYLPEEDGFAHYRCDPEDPRTLNDDVVWCVRVTRAGTVIAGTQRGVARWEPDTDTWHRYLPGTDSSPGLSHPSVTDILEGRDGGLWVGTYGGGLNRLDLATGAVRVYRERDGLPSDVVVGVLEDDDGVLWISTNHGLAQFNPATGQWYTYDEHTGVQGPQFNRGARLRSRTGELLFGGTRGLTVFDPRAVQPNTNPPPVVLTGLEIFNRAVTPATPDSPLVRSITETRRLELPAADSVITFRFAALNYRSPERNQYRYRLEGFDAEWRPSGSEREATYTNLDPGRYYFRVRASNNQGVWNELGVDLELVIVPPWWSTLWFRSGAVSLGALFLVGLGWAVSSRRSRARVREARREQALARERQHTAEALRRSEERFRTYFDESLLAMAITSPAKGWLAVNDRLCELLGYSREELTRMTWSELTHPDDLAGDVAQFDRMLRGELEGYSLEKRFLRKDGSVVQTILSVRVVRRSDRAPDYCLAQLQNISELRQAEAERLRLEQQVHQGQRLESLGVLAGGIAHDFNNLLTAILGNASLVQDELPPGSPATEGLGEIAKTARRASELCQQMLAYSGRGQLVVEAVDLGRLVEEIVRLLKTSISKKAVLNLALESGLPAIQGDPSQLRQIVMNLVINASEALGDQTGVIWLSMGTAVGERSQPPAGLLGQDPPEGPLVWLEVSDTGCGMDPETLERIFEPFFTTKFTGRGLGLSAVLGIVRGHHGAIAVTSTPGKGTKFRLFFPAIRGTPAPLVKPASDPLAWRGHGSVLLVDDEEPVRKVGSRMLERWGFQVLQAADGEAALEVYRQHQDDIRWVLLDLTMPRLNGEETCRELLRLNPTARIIIASGYSETDIASRFAGLSVAGFVQKPFSPDELRERLRVLLG